ncbi:MAG TPA: hypothetical protein VGW38_27140 [Chloroflexota bacterium]|nr:hypothetical protein [Chloroflexota bacterium]
MNVVKTAVIAGAVALGIGFAGPTLAAHEHWLQTPGTCVEDIASGQTSKATTEPGGHKFHEQVHLGMPGETAFANEANPVSVGKGNCS